MTTATRIRRSPEQLAAYNKIVKKAVGKAKAGKKFPAISESLAELTGEPVNPAQLRTALNALIESGDLTFEGKTRACTYFAI